MDTIKVRLAPPPPPFGVLLGANGSVVSGIPVRRSRKQRCPIVQIPVFNRRRQKVVHRLDPRPRNAFPRRTRIETSRRCVFSASRIRGSTTLQAVPQKSNDSTYEGRGIPFLINSEMIRRTRVSETGLSPSHTSNCRVGSSSGKSNSNRTLCGAPRSSTDSTRARMCLNVRTCPASNGGSRRPVAPSTAGTKPPSGLTSRDVPSTRRWRGYAQRSL